MAAGYESRRIVNTVGIDVPLYTEKLECLVTEAEPQMFYQMLGCATADFMDIRQHMVPLCLEAPRDWI